ncbi:MAG: hypothetical protein QOK36_716, partial [Gaiellales bacterium]|nr:hypothetical protein [Gaiellales bacterium]
DCHFDYGTSASYGSSAPCSQAPGSSAGPVAVSALLSGLTANTTYHFRIVASNEHGTRFGADRAFATLPAPPTVVTGGASALTQTTATLNGEVNPGGAPTTDCHFEYGTSAFYEASRPCDQAPGSGVSPVPVSASADGLVANTSYHFRVVAGNQGGSAFGADQTFTTLPNPPTISQVRPAAGRESGGTTVTISGTDLSTATAVRFGAVEAAGFTVVSDGEITVVSPAGSGTVDIAVVTAGGTSSTGAADRFTYAPPPAVTGVTPATGPAAGGTTVAISGANLAGATAVSFGPAKAAQFTVNSPSSIRAVSPPGTSGAADVTVTTAGGTSALSPKDQFRFGAPTVTGVTPSSGPAAGGTTVTVSGTGFAPGTGETTFAFGAPQATSVSCSSTTSCSVVTPAHKATTVDLKATVGAFTSKRVTEDQFTFG